MAFTPAIPLQDPTYTKMQFDGGVVNAAEIVYAVESALENKLLVYGHIKGFQDGENPPQWRIVLKRPADMDEMVADAGSWIVVSSLGVIRVLTDTEYHAEFAQDQEI